MVVDAAEIKRQLASDFGSAAIWRGDVASADQSLTSSKEQRQLSFLSVAAESLNLHCVNQGLYIFSGGFP